VSLFRTGNSALPVAPDRRTGLV